MPERSPMQEFPFQKFINLISFDQEINELEKVLKNKEDEVERIQHEEHLLKEEVFTLKKERDERQRTVHEHELHMKDLDVHQKDLQKKLDELQDHKAYQGLRTELDHVKKKQHDYEGTLVRAWQDLESSARKYEEFHEKSQSKLTEFQSIITGLIQEINYLNGQLAEKNSARAEKAEGIPEEWLEKYAIMRRSVKNPVVKVVNGACSGCFYQVTAQDLARLHRNALLQCKDCYRFIYVESRNEAA